MLQLWLKHRVPLIVALIVGLAAGVIAHPLLYRQAEARVIADQYHQLALATADIARVSGSLYESLLVESMQLGLVAREPGCPQQLQQQLQTIQLNTPGVQAALRVEGRQITCASLPLLLQGATELPADYTLRSDQARFWHQLHLSQTPGKGPYVLIEYHQLGLLLQAHERFSRFLGDDIAMAVYEARPPHTPTLQTGHVHSHWLQPLAAGQRQQHDRDPASGDLIVRRLSASGQTVLLASRQAGSVQQAIKDSTRYLWSQALLVGLGCMVLALLLYPRQNSSSRELRRALRRGRLFLLYQPVIDLHSGRCIGAEALMRWRQSETEVIGPDFFIPLAEKLQIIDQITERSCQILARELPGILAVQPDFRISLNLSAQELTCQRTVQRLDALRQQLRLPPSQLMVEITESCLINADDALPVINQLRANGIGVAIDDFGTGYCSLSYLANFPFDIIKIDKAFINASGTDSVIGTIAEHITVLGRSLGAQTLAEGIETAGQAANFRQLGVEYAQGYYFGAPMPIAQLLKLLQRPAQF